MNGDNFKKFVRVFAIMLFHSSNLPEVLETAYVATIGIMNMNIHPPYLVENANPPNNEAIKKLLIEYFALNCDSIKIVAKINVCSKGFGLSLIHI